VERQSNFAGDARTVIGTTKHLGERQYTQQQQQLAPMTSPYDRTERKDNPPEEDASGYATERKLNADEFFFFELMYCFTQKIIHHDPNPS
jgi:hypothetical protein